jgi:tRNA uridine 5-carboxymethylaminomethyl modification enzyme
MLRLEHIRFPERFDFSKITNISTEARQKLIAIQPETLGQASRISGVNPADISILLMYLGR